MHQSSYNSMREIVEKYLNRNTEYNILDVGSYDVNGSYKNLFGNPLWKYTGLDVSVGPNVDLVSEDPYNWPIKDETYDILISGQCLEHVEMPWLWIKEVERVCKHGAIIAIIAPWQCMEHRYPVDCWRLLPDGMKVLLTKCTNMEIISCSITNTIDTVSIARRK